MEYFPTKSKNAAYYNRSRNAPRRDGIHFKDKTARTFVRAVLPSSSSGGIKNYFLDDFLGVGTVAMVWRMRLATR
jgi:hypothetical protein